MPKRTMNLKAVKAAIESPKTPVNLKKGLIKKYGSQLGITSPGSYGVAPSKAPRFKKKNPLAKWETPSMHKRVKRCVKHLKGAKGISPYAVCKASVHGTTKHNPKLDYSKYPIFERQTIFEGPYSESSRDEYIKELKSPLTKKKDYYTLKTWINDAEKLEYKIIGGSGKYKGVSIDWWALKGNKLMGEFYRNIRSGHLLLNPILETALGVGAGIVVGEIGKDFVHKRILKRNPGAKWHKERIDRHTYSLKKSEERSDNALADYNAGARDAHIESFNASKKLGINPRSGWKYYGHANSEKEAKTLGQKIANKLRTSVNVSHIKSRGRDRWEISYKSLKKNSSEMKNNPWHRTEHKFNSRAEAKGIGQKLADHYGVQVRAEKCPNTGKWHLYIKKSKMMSNPPKGAVKIYDDILAIEAKKGNNSLWPREKFRHDFKSKKGKAAIYGMPDGSLMISSSKKLWKNFDYAKEDV